MKLYSTSCSSSSFCVAVGDVRDVELNAFPLAETYSHGSWTSSILPMPPNAVQINSNGGHSYAGALSSVSCPSDGVCAAVGTYEAYHPSLNESLSNGLLEVLSSGTWTVSEGSFPDGPFSGSVNLNGVSCSDPGTCVAVGTGWATTGPNATNEGVIFSLNADAWTMQFASVPFANGRDVALNGISCPDDSTCVAVGTYANTYRLGVGLIVTLSSGAWTAAPAPLPSNVETGRDPLVTPVEDISGVSCPEADVCVAGGLYGDNVGNAQALLLELRSGAWTALRAPVPSDAQSNPEANIEAVDCPAAGSCIATGDYFINELADEYSGMILTQANGAWTAVPGPLPPDLMASVRISSPRQSAILTASGAAGSASGSSLAGVSCADDGFCAAGGNDGANGLLETGGISGLPAVSGVTPDSGPAQGGTSVMVSGANFDLRSVVEFDGVAAATTFVNPGRLMAISPSAPSPKPVDVTVTTGTLTSRANFLGAFQYLFSTLTVATKLPPAWLKHKYSAALSAGGGHPPYRWSVVSGALPPGLHVKPSGMITGKPRAKGTSTFTVQVKDHRARHHPKEVASRTVSITVE